MTADTLWLASLLFGAVAFGGLLPFARRWSEAGLHALVALSAGIFLGSVFLHLLPELMGVHLHADGHGHHHGHLHAHAAGEDCDGHFFGGTLWTLIKLGTVLIGLIGLWGVQRGWIGPWLTSKGYGGTHELAWRAALLALSIHALLTGLGLAGLSARPEHWALWSAMLLHKGTEGFSLGSLLRLARLPGRRALVVIFGFSCVAPLGLLLGAQVAAGLGMWAELLTAFACGTFLYVALFELLPEVFHGAGSRLWRWLLVIVGIAMAGLVPLLGDLALAEIGGQMAAVFIGLAPYLLLGCLLAGAIAVWLPPERVRSLIAGERPRSVGLAAVLGAPLPLCSCAVLPMAAALRQAGAGRGATSAFLIATPETGADSVATTYALFDPLMTVARPAAAVTSALVTGGAVAAFARRGKHVEPEPAPPPETCSHGGLPLADGHVHDPCHPETHGEVAALDVAPGGRGPGALRALRYGFVDLIDDLGPALVLGIAAAGALAALLPAELFAHPAWSGWPAYLAMLVVGLPVYLCAAAATPIAAALVLKGLSPGAALVFLLAAPALNAASFLFLRRLLGAPAAWVHLGALAVVTLLLGRGLDALYAWWAIEPGARVSEALHLGPDLVHQGAAWILALLLLWAFFQRVRRSALAAMAQPLTSAYVHRH